MYTILCNMKGSRKLSVDETHLKTIDRYSLFSDLLDKAPWYAGIAIGTLIAALLLLTWLIVKLRRTLKRKNK